MQIEKDYHIMMKVHTSHSTVVQNQRKSIQCLMCHALCSYREIFTSKKMCSPIPKSKVSICNDVEARSHFLGDSWKLNLENTDIDSHHSSVPGFTLTFTRWNGFEMSTARTTLERTKPAKVIRYYGIFCISITYIRGGWNQRLNKLRHLRSKIN